MYGSDKTPNVQPREILDEEFLKPLEISAYKLAKATLIPATIISQIIKGNRRITADTALIFGKFFGNTADFWLGIQMEYDLRKEKAEIEYVLEKLKNTISTRLCFLDTTKGFRTSHSPPAAEGRGEGEIMSYYKCI